MNATSVTSVFETMDDDMGPRTYEPMPRKQRRPESRRKGNGGSGGGFQFRRNKQHTWGSGAGARLADLRAFAGAIALLLVAAVTPASAGSFGGASAPSGIAATPFTGFGRLTHGYKAESLAAESSDDADGALLRAYDPQAGAFAIRVQAEIGDRLTDTTARIAADDLAGWFAADEDALPAPADTLSATQIAASGPSPAPSEWPVAAEIAPAVSTTDILVDSSRSGAPELFGEYVNTYSTYGVWETISADRGAAPGSSGDWLTGATESVAMVGADYLITSLDRTGGSSVPVVAVPEPSNTVAGILALGGLIAMHGARRRKAAPAPVVVA